MDPKALLFTLFLCVGCLFCGISLPLLLGMIGPNPWYGFRVKKTLDDPAVWYPANRVGAVWMMGAAVLLMVVALAGYALFPRLGFVAYAFTCLGAVVVGFGIAITRTMLYLRKL
jgi:hypothetical protein